MSHRAGVSAASLDNAGPFSQVVVAICPPTSHAGRVSFALGPVTQGYGQDLPNLRDVQLNLTVVLKFIFLLTSEAEHLFIYII